MNSTVFIIIAVCYVLCGYLSARGVHVMCRKRWLSAIVVLISVTFPLTMYMMHNAYPDNWPINILCYIGCFSSGFIMYFSGCCAILFTWQAFYKPLHLRAYLSMCCALVLVLLAYGYRNATHIRLTRLELPSTVRARFCFVSDIHFGSIKAKDILNSVIDYIQRTNPDFVIFGGDLLDINALCIYKADFINAIKRIKVPMYAVIGNHELYTGLERCAQLMREVGITVLLDNHVYTNNLCIVGRTDVTYDKRKSLQDVMPPSASNVIIVDHNPSGIQQSIDNNIYLHLSGHTHDGQIFPINLLTNFIYKVRTGILRKVHNTYYYVSPGAGFWGPPYRIGNHPEVVLIDLNPSK